MPSCRVQLECECAFSSHCRVLWLSLVPLHVTPSLKPSSPQTFSERDSDNRILYFHHDVSVRGLLLHLIFSNQVKCVSSVPLVTALLLLLPFCPESFIKNRIGYYKLGIHGSTAGGLSIIVLCWKINTIIHV